ncbi:hypothetical protein IAQ61_007737 [Plenodomus lingam]|uniref:uncharacterized protein n=1 Tax=Leptosphaeria maculans TaxID=5022 RepID=UPI00331AC945|nr:hypothetical protein IAQ61_007737 [Plenodomus lingam]
MVPFNAFKCNPIQHPQKKIPNTHNHKAMPLADLASLHCIARVARVASEHSRRVAFPKPALTQVCFALSPTPPRLH